MMNESTRTAAADGEPAPPTVATGAPGVDEALSRLADLPDQPDATHVEAFEHAYQRLHGLLDELDTRHTTGEEPDDQAEQA